ncbi:hypothetical protein KI387_001480 [Taxus chinensis]|uniref:Uncharacterized protein n=1 Tax=Taxus chinensis TaxID=29808 RepID=A0AA38GX85_TAXCH|nr:hypothetical protein KI387_001480 [Taxus chinensis]
MSLPTPTKGKRATQRAHIVPKKISFVVGSSSLSKVPASKAMSPAILVSEIVEVTDSPSISQGLSSPLSLPLSLPTSFPSISSFPSPSMAQVFSSLPVLSAGEMIGSPISTSLPLTLPFPSISSSNPIVSTPMAILTSTPSIIATSVQMPTNVTGALVLTSASGTESVVPFSSASTIPEWLFHQTLKQKKKTALGNLLEKYDKDKASKDELKEKVEQLTALLRKVTQPSPSTEISTTTALTVSSTLDDISYHEIEKIGQKGRSVNGWMERILQEANPLIKEAIDIYNDLQAERTSIQKMDETFSEDNNNLNLNLTTWSEIKEENSDLLLQEYVIDEASKLLEYQKAMEFRSQVLQDIIKKLDDKRIEIMDALNDISEEFDNINFKFFNENIDALPEDQIKLNFKDLVKRDDEVTRTFYSDSIDRYLKSPEVFEEEIEKNPELVALDDEFRESFSIIMERFFLLFDGIIRYYQNLVQYLEDLQEGVYVQSTIESVMENEDGRQLLVEALALHGTILFLLEHRLNGGLREQLLVAHLRNKRSSEISNLDHLCMLCQTFSPVSASPLSSITTFVPFRQSSPSSVTPTMILVHRPEDLFGRFPIPKPIVDVVITRLRGDDLYNQVRHYPIPEHWTTALASQAGCVYILLFYSPELLASGYVMKEIVDRFFKDNWIVPIFMAFTVDLSFSWERYKAAKSALSSTLASATVRDLCDKHYSKVKDLLIDLRGLMSDGVLTPDYVMNNTQNLVSSLRNCNVTLRWLLLHRCTVNKKIRDSIVTVGNSHNVTEDVLLLLLLETAKLEFELKRVYGELLEGKESRWKNCRSQAAERMQELSDFFSGSKV